MTNFLLPSSNFISLPSDMAFPITSCRMIIIYELLGCKTFGFHICAYFVSLCHPSLNLLGLLIKHVYLNRKILLPCILWLCGVYQRLKTNQQEAYDRIFFRNGNNIHISFTCEDQEILVVGEPNNQVIHIFMAHRTTMTDYELFMLI